MARVARTETPAGVPDTGGDQDDFLDLLCRGRRDYALPPRLRELAERFTQGILELLFAHFTPETRCRHREVEAEHAALRALLARALDVPGEHAVDRDAVVAGFFAKLPEIREALLLDAEALFAFDPAAHSVDEVILAYPGFHATAMHRIAHELYRRDVPIFPRLLTEVAHRDTGIDIHPGAQIGRCFAIDHGTGTVVGETAVLGERVKLYQGVTLGALSVSKRKAGTKRHPTIGDDVVIYANATILGGDTVIGRGSLIGGNVWLTRSVPAHSVVTPTAHVDRRESGGDDDLLDFNI
jgi:serine O-acetyltransferase